MTSTKILQELIELRLCMAPLVTKFEVDDFSRGIVGIVPVVGGRFFHPRTKQAISELKVYGAGKNLVKVLTPRFLASLPQISIVGITNPAQFCARLALKLKEKLDSLKDLRASLQGLMIESDLDKEILQLKGTVDLSDMIVEVVANMPSQLEVVAIGKHVLEGQIDRSLCRLTLSGKQDQDRQAFLDLAHRLDLQVRNLALEEVEQGLQNLEERLSPLGDEAEFSFGSEKNQEVFSGVTRPSAARSFSNHLGSNAGTEPHMTPSAFSKKIVTLPDALWPKNPLASTSQPPGVKSTPQPMQTEDALDSTWPPAPMPAHRPVPVPAHHEPKDSIEASDIPEVLELTEAVDATAETMEVQVFSPPEATDIPSEPIPIKPLLEKLGSQTEVLVQEGKLVFQGSLKVVQGIYRFRLQQANGSSLQGVLVSPRGTETEIAFDLHAIDDIKDVFDQVVLGKT